ncbi:MBG domain-containing protein [Myroides sp. DW712]|uniref:MBG domain-containing protein n=1 Tax=Myroides sp. DW712 TaxID=3389800 RepID=UPI00397C9BCC
MKQKLLLTWLFLLSFSLSMLSQIQIGSGTSTNNYIPIQTSYNYSISQQIVLKSEYTDGQGIAGDITKIKWYVTSNSNYSNSWDLWDVYIGHTTKTSFTGSSDWVDLDTATLVFSGTITPVNGQWMEIELTTPFAYNGTDNFVVTVVDKKPGYTYSYPAFRSYSATNRGLYAYQDGALINTTDLSANSNKARTSTVAQLQLVGTLSPCSKPEDLFVTGVTATTATINWVSNAIGTLSHTYEVRTNTNVGTAAGREQDGTASNVEEQIDLTALSPDTLYYFYIKTDCEDDLTTPWAMISFRTPCESVNIPYVLDVNSTSTLPACVVVEDVNADNKKWEPVAKPSSSGFVDARVMRYTYHISNVANDWFFTPGLNMVAGQSYRLKFKYRDYGYREKLRVSYGLQNVSTAMTEELFTVETDASETTGSEEIDFVAPTTGVYYIGFQAYSPVNYYYLYVGDIKVELSPTCLKPTNVNLTSATQVSATFGWTASTSMPANGYAYEVRTAGNPGEATGLVEAGTTAAGVVTATVNGLTANTAYKFYVKAVCSTTDQSEWAEVLDFRTLCNIENVPYVLSMDDVTTPTIPFCVGVEDVNEDGKTWQSYAKPSGSSFVGTKVMGYPYHASNAANDWFYTHALNLTAGQSYRLKFKYSHGNYSEKLRVSYGTSAVNTAMTTQLFEVTTGTSTATVEEIIDFTPTTTGVYYFGFQAFSDRNKNILYVGDIEIDKTPTCFVPGAITVDEATLTYDTVTFSWIVPEQAPASGYEYEIRTSGNPGEATGRVATGSVAAGVLTATVNGLTPLTDYKIYIRSKCIGTDVSIWTPGQAFKTLCLPPVITSTTGATVCGFGEATLQATSNEGTFRWYETATSSTVLGTGSSFTTPELTATTSYWVSGVGTNMTTGSGGKLRPETSASNSSTTNWGIVFNVTEDLVLKSTDVYSGANNSAVTVKILNPAGVEIFTSASIPLVNGGATTPNVIPLNVPLVAGNGYKILLKAYTGSILRDNSNLAFPYGGSNDKIKVTSSEWGGITTSYYYYFYNLQYEIACLSERKEVVATVNPAPNFTLSTAAVEICREAQSNVVRITAGATDYDTYEWIPATGVTGNATTGWTLSPAETTTYTLVASQSNGACQTRVMVEVVVKPTPEAIGATESLELCPGSVGELTAGMGAVTEAVFGTGTQSTTSNYPNTFSGWYGGVKHQILYTKEELLTKGLVAGSEIRTLAFELGDAAAKECKDFTIRIGTTTRTAMTSTFVDSSTLTTVYNQSFTPSVTGFVSFTLTTPYIWDGVSNLIVETVHNAGNSGNGTGTSNRYTTTTFDSVAYGAKDSVGQGIAGMDALTSFSSSGTSKNRPNIKFGFTTFSQGKWAPVAGLYTNPEGTSPYTGDARTKVYVKLTEPKNYTLTVKNEESLCEITREVTVSIATVGSFELEQSTFCQTVNVADIPMTITAGVTAKWYASETSTTVLTTLTQTGTYYVELSNETCSAPREAVEIEIVQPVLPIADADQSLCEDTTLADLVVEHADRFESKWYASETATEALPDTTVLTNGTTYYVSSYFSQIACESDRVAVTVHLSRTPAPTALAQQKFCLVTNPTVADLAADGTDVKWYTTAVGGTALAATTALQDNTVYYASQKLNNCESDIRTAVTVSVEEILYAPTIPVTEVHYTYGDTATALEAILTGGDELVWFVGDSTQESLTAPTPSTSTVGTTSYWVAQRIIDGCESDRAEIKVHVAPAVLTVVANNQTKVYGQVDPALTFTVTGFKLTDTVSVLRGRLAREVGENVGEYEIGLGTLSAENYTFDYTPATFKITPAALRVKANPITKVYGQVDPALTFVGEGYKLNDNNSSLTGVLEREAGEDIGSYAILQGTLASTNYTITFTENTFTITPASLKITLANQTKVYGEADPILNYQVQGLTNGDTTAVITGNLTREPGENVGTYAYQQGTIATTANYNLEYELGNLVITPAPLQIEPLVDQHKIYGQDDPVLNYTATGFKFTDTTAVISGALARAEGENVRVYPYSLGTLRSLHNNYAFVLNTNNTFEIKPAPLMIVVHENQRKVFGSVDPVFTYTIQGMQFNDRAVQAISGSLGRVAGEAVGIYPINQGTLVARSNYYIDLFTPSTFEIVRNEVGNITLPSKTFTYDGTVKSLAVVGDLPPTAVVTYVNNNQTEVGDYTVKAIVDYGPNFEIKELEGELRIVKAPQVITFDELDIVILDETPSFQLNARASSRLPIRYEVTFIDQPILTMTPAGVVTPLQVGTAKITAYQDGNENYLPAIPVSRTLIIKNNSTEITELFVDGVSYGKIQEETYVILDCGTNSNTVNLEVVVPIGTTVKPGNHIVVDVTEYGLHQQEIEVVSEDGTKTKVYTVIIDKRLATTNIVYQKYENMLLVNNDPKTNGGYTFVKFEWYKDNELIGTEQAYSAGNEYGMKLDPAATYHAVLTLKNGTKFTTCPIDLGFELEEELQVYPNPVRKTEALNIVLDTKTDYENSYIIYNVLGQVIAKGSFNGNRTELNLPTTVTTGSYFLVLKAGGKHQSVQFIVRE